MVSFNLIGMKSKCFAFLVCVILGSGGSHANVFAIRAEFGKPSEIPASLVVRDIVGQSDRFEFTRKGGNLFVRITYQFTRTDKDSPEFILEQKVELKTEKQHLKFVWDESHISPDVKKEFLFVRDVKVMADGTIKFVSERTPIEFELMTDSGVCLKSMEPK
jgi:hypothetical protein